MMYFFEEDDKFLGEINQDYRAGKILAGEMKQMCIERATDWLSNLAEKSAMKPLTWWTSSLNNQDNLIVSRF